MSEGNAQAVPHLVPPETNEPAPVPAPQLTITLVWLTNGAWESTTDRPIPPAALCGILQALGRELAVKLGIGK